MMNPLNIQKYTYRWFIHQFENAKEKAENLASQKSEKMLIHKPSPDQWSATECLAHLNTFGTIYYSHIQKAINQAESFSAGVPNTFRPRFFWRCIVRLFEPPYKLKMNTISSFKPPQNKSPNSQHILRDFFDLQDQLINQLQYCKKHTVDLNDIRIKNPALSFIKMRLSEGYAIVDAHQRRHLWQARRTIETMNKHTN